MWDANWAGAGPFRYYDRRARRWRRGDRARARVVPRKGLARARRPAFTPTRSIALIVIVAMCLSALHAVSRDMAFAYVQLGAFSSPLLPYVLGRLDDDAGSGSLPITPQWAMMGARRRVTACLLRHQHRIPIRADARPVAESSAQRLTPRSAPAEPGRRRDPPGRRTTRCARRPELRRRHHRRPRARGLASLLPSWGRK